MTRSARNAGRGRQPERSRARRMALQATYQLLMNDENPADIVEQFLANDANDNFDVDYFKRLFIGSAEAESEILASVSQWLDRPLEQLDPIERSVFQVSCFEMKFHTEVPHKVIINEAVELAKAFGAEDSHKYINAIMDKAAATWRSNDVNPGRN